MTPPSMTTGALMQALRDHYIPPSRAGQPGGVLATEVAVNGAYGAGRRCDALWAGFTSSSGRILIGHELKVSRSDWRAELDKANKADTWADACHAWYIVAPSTAIVPPEEIPAGWGLMIPPTSSRARRMRVIVKAQVKANHEPPWWAVRSLMARLDTLAQQERQHEVQALADQEVARARKKWEQQARMSPKLTPEQRWRLETLEDLERALGLTIDRYASWRDTNRVSPDQLKSALELVTTLQSLVYTSDLGEILTHLIREITRTKNALEATAEEFPSLVKEAGPSTTGR